MTHFVKEVRSCGIDVSTSVADATERSMRSRPTIQSRSECVERTKLMPVGKSGMLSDRPHVLTSAYHLELSSDYLRDCAIYENTRTFSRRHGNYHGERVEFVAGRPNNIRWYECASTLAAREGDSTSQFARASVALLTYKSKVPDSCFLLPEKAYSTVSSLIRVANGPLGRTKRIRSATGQRRIARGRESCAVSLNSCGGV